MSLTYRNFEPALRHAIEAAITTQAWPEFVLSDMYGHSTPYGNGKARVPVGYQVAGWDHPEAAEILVQVVLTGHRDDCRSTDPQEMFHTDPTKIFNWVREHCSGWDYLLGCELNNTMFQFDTPKLVPNEGGVFPVISYVRQNGHVAQERVFSMHMHVYVSFLRQTRSVPNLAELAVIPPAA